MYFLNWEFQVCVSIDCELARKKSTHRVTEADSYWLYPWPCLDCGINPVTQQVESTVAHSSLGSSSTEHCQGKR